MLRDPRRRRGSGRETPASRPSGGTPEAPATGADGGREGEPAPAGSAGAGGFYDLPGAEPDAGVAPDLPPWPAPEESPGAPAPEPGEGSYGIPAGLDLATAFVPMQSAASYRNQFPYEEALRQGSLWPDLVRPYAGRPWRRPAGGGREWTR